MWLSPCSRSTRLKERWYHSFYPLWGGGLQCIHALSGIFLQPSIWVFWEFIRLSQVCPYHKARTQVRISGFIRCRTLIWRKGFYNYKVQIIEVNSSSIYKSIFKSQSCIYLFTNFTKLSNFFTTLQKINLTNNGNILL